MPNNIDNVYDDTNELSDLILTKEMKSLQTCKPSVVNRPLHSESNASFKLFKIFTSEFGAMSMYRQFCVCMYDFLTMVTEGVVHVVHKVVIWSSFSEICGLRQVEVNGHFATVTQAHIQILKGS